MAPLHVFTFTLRAAGQGLIVGVERCWMSSSREPDKISRDAEFCCSVKHF